MEHSPKAVPRSSIPIGALWVILLLIGSFALFLLFVWVLFFSPTGQSEAVQVDFNIPLPAAYSAVHEPEKPEFRVAVAAMVSPEHTFDLYGDLIQYLGEKLRMRARIVQRMTYREINDLIGRGSIDLGFICTGPFLLEMGAGRMEALVVPVVDGQTSYRAYLIVPRTAPYKRLSDLRGKVLAFTDPDSLTGFLYPGVLLHRMGESAESFFSRTFFSHSHTDSMHAVAHGIADAASVNSLVYDFYQRTKPAETASCRILLVSEPFGIPPVVVSRRIREDLKGSIREVLLGMHEDPFGSRILKQMRIDAFVPAETVLGLYQETRELIFPEQESLHPGALPPWGIP